MTQKQFYSKVTQIETLKVELEDLNLTQEEKAHLSRLIDASLHNTILDLILSELSEEDKRVFLDHLVTDDHTKIWQHLNKNIEGVEKKIRKAADELHKELKRDIHEVKKDA